jgi:hypothetical protein
VDKSVLYKTVFLNSVTTVQTARLYTVYLQEVDFIILIAIQCNFATVCLSPLIIFSGLD